MFCSEVKDQPNPKLYDHDWRVSGVSIKTRVILSPRFDPTAPVFQSKTALLSPHHFRSSRTIGADAGKSSPQGEIKARMFRIAPAKPQAEWTFRCRTRLKSL
jgi:hypothetical protein